MPEAGAISASFTKALPQVNVKSVYTLTIVSKYAGKSANNRLSAYLVM